MAKPWVTKGRKTTELIYPANRVGRVAGCLLRLEATEQSGLFICSAALEPYWEEAIADLL